MPHHIIQTECIQCQACAPTCPYGAIQEKNGIIFVEPSLCIDCEACREPCPTNCFSILDERSAREEINRLFAHNTTPTNPSENQNPNKDAESSQKGESSEGNTQTSTGESSDKDNKGEGQKGEGDSSQKGEQDSSKGEGESSTGNAESSEKNKQDSLLPPPPNTNYKQHKNFARNNDTTKLLSHDKITRAFLVA